MSAETEKKKSETRKRASSHSIRFNDAVWVRWNELKDRDDYRNHNEFAEALLDRWEEVRLPEVKQTPQKNLPTVLFSTPGTSGITRPIIEASDISKGSESERSEDSLIKKYQLKAQEADDSFIEITFEVSEDEDLKKDLSYNPTLMSEEEWEDDEESDIDEYEYDDDFSIDMSLRRENEEDLREVPERSVSDQVIDMSDSDDGEDSGEDEVQKTIEGNLVKENKCICFESQLTILAAMKPIEKCQDEGCDLPVSIVSKYVGTSVELKWVCSRNHEARKWCSQPLIKKVKAGDFLLSAAILCSGNNFSKVHLMFKFLSLGMLSQTTHNQIQSKHTTVVVETHFDNMMRRNCEKYRGQEIVVAGDGRMDSPGHSAQYCTYTLLEYDTKDIVACEIIDKRMTNMKSTNMEKEGLVRALKRLHESGVVVKELCTDASTSIAAMIRKDHPTMIHTFDTWHGAKNFGKKLGGVAAESKNKDLRPWVPDIINHFWYCSKMANGSEDAILARWRGALHHVTNVHEWALGDHAIEPKCDHDPINEEREWLEPGGDAHMALTRVMLDVRFLRNLSHFVNFRHTGELETFHEHILMYAAKRFAYKYPAYKARNFLAALDYTEHSDRPVMFNKDGQPRLHRAYSKRNGNWTCYQEKEPKKYNHIGQIMQDVIQSYLDSKVPLRAKTVLHETDPRRIKRHLAAESPPPTKHLMSVKKSRF